MQTEPTSIERARGWADTAADSDDAVSAAAAATAQAFALISIAESLERLAACVSYGQSGGPRFRS